MSVEFASKIASMSVHIYWYLDRRSVNKEGLYPIKIALSHDGIVDYIRTGCFTHQTDFDLLIRSQVPKRLGDLYKTLRDKENQIRKICDQIKVIDIKLIRSLLKQSDTPSVSTLKDRLGHNIYRWFDHRIEELIAIDAIGTAESYRCSRNFFQKITSVTYMEFGILTKLQLYSIHKKALSKGLSEDTVYKHMRQLRSIFNMAIQEKLISQDVYPFGKRGYLIPQTNKTRKALSSEDITKLNSYVPDNPSEQESLDYFIFSYFGNGINFKDLSYLRYRDIQGDYLNYVRKKTRTTSTKPKLIRVYLTSEMKEIIERQGNEPRRQDQFIFPIINDDDSLEQQRRDYRRLNKIINKRLDDIRQKLDIKSPVTHGVSRHSFATALKRSGSSVEEISEMLGHSSVAVTEHYLSSFEDDTLSKNVEKLRKYAGK